MWIPITLLAATIQIIRTSRQHLLRPLLSVAAAGYARFLYALPFALAALAGTRLIDGPLPQIPARFWPAVIGAGVAQIVGTMALLRAFDLRDFAIGTIYSKTEVLLVAAVSTIFLGEPLRLLGWVAALVMMVGVIWLAAPGKLATVAAGAGDPAAWMGTLAGGLFAVTSVLMRYASTSLGDGSVWTRSLMTLTAMLMAQTLINGVQLQVMEPASVRAVLREWRPAGIVGLMGFAGSALWSLGFTLTNATKVRTLGQIELVIAFAVSVWWLHEEHTRSEYAASVLVLLGIVGVVAFG